MHSLWEAEREHGSACTCVLFLLKRAIVASALTLPFNGPEHTWSFSSDPAFILSTPFVLSIPWKGLVLLF